MSATLPTPQVETPSVQELLERLVALSQDVVRDEALRRRRVAVLRQLERIQRSR